MLESDIVEFTRLCKDKVADIEPPPSWLDPFVPECDPNFIDHYGDDD